MNILRKRFRTHSSQRLIIVFKENKRQINKLHRWIAIKQWIEFTRTQSSTLIRKQTTIKEFHEIDHYFNKWINDNKKTLQRFALKQKRFCIETKKLKNINSIILHLFHNRSHLIMYENDYLCDTSIRQSIMYEIIIYWHSLNCHLIETFSRSSTWYFIHFSIFVTLSFIQLHVNEKVKNKNI